MSLHLEGGEGGREREIIILNIISHAATIMTSINTVEPPLFIMKINNKAVYLI